MSSMGQAKAKAFNKAQRVKPDTRYHSNVSNIPMLFKCAYGCSILRVSSLSALGEALVYRAGDYQVRHRQINSQGPL